ncbi:BMP family protein [Microbacterium sp. Marseille-Q6965]|uniref:BMP family lipoprotein n=1 Tax=Microbacterium sp. Marseille-Q6965 TaxID=2965072 RepID=UPI0021B70ED7|nr:BMP family ABC transporter substrate-binding protein [Microbacterium sp. Marseille-Q6965]
MTTLKRGLAGLGMAAAAGMVLAGCGAAPEDGGDGAPAEGTDFMACAVSDEGSWNDQSFNEAAYAGLEMAEEELGIEINDAESNSTEDFAPNLQTMVDGGCDVIFAVGFGFGDTGALEQVAQGAPETHFVWIDGWDLGLDNVKVIDYAMEQSSYLAGYLSAGYSTSKVLGTYGGSNMMSVTKFMDGFYYGAMAWGEENGEDVTVLGWDPANPSGGSFTANFGDTAGATSITASQLSQGADVFYPVAGGLFAATIEVIRTEGAPAVVLGVDRDIATTQPQYADIILTSVEKRMTQAVFDNIEVLVSGEEFTTEPYVGTLENDGTALSEFGEFDGQIDDALKTRLDELTEEIIAGEIEIPVTGAE